MPHSPTQMADLRNTDRAEERAPTGAGRLAVVASLGTRALTGEDLDLLLDEAVKAVAGGLGTEYAVAFQLLPGGEEFLLRAGVGLREGKVGSFRAAAGIDSQAGYTLVANEPVVIEDFATEPRFTKPPMMVEHGVVSAVSVIIRGYDGPWGVLGSATTAQRRFSGEDVAFAQAVANVVGAAVERGRFEEARQQARQNERLAAVGQRAAGVAHDLNNIVSTIGYLAQRLEDDQALDDAGRQHLATIRDQVEQATSLMWQVLDFAHSTPPQRAEEDLATFLGELAPVLARSLRPGVSIRLDHDEAGYVVDAERTALEQIFTNLASNAKDAMVGPGELRITLSRHEVSATEPPPLEGMAPGRWVSADVADTGTGMAPEVLARVFEPFFTTKAPGQGTGVGLNQVLRLVGEHDGHVDIVSQPGKGTTVSIWLPAAGGPHGSR